MNNIQKGLLVAFESSGLTYDELAKKTNLPKSALYRYLNGDTEKIPIDRFQAVCQELHVDAGTLLGWKDQPPEDHPDDPLNDPQIRIVSGYMENMTEEQKKQIVAIVRAVVGTSK